MTSASKTVACQAVVANAYVLKNVQHRTQFLASLSRKYKKNWQLRMERDESVIFAYWYFYCYMYEKRGVIGDFSCSVIYYCRYEFILAYRFALLTPNYTAIRFIIFRIKNKYCHI